jgi:hypothetical protein
MENTGSVRGGFGAPAVSTPAAIFLLEERLQVTCDVGVLGVRHANTISKHCREKP